MCEDGRIVVVVEQCSDQEDVLKNPRMFFVWPMEAGVFPSGESGVGFVYLLEVVIWFDCLLAA